MIKKTLALAFALSLAAAGGVLAFPHDGGRGDHPFARHAFRWHGVWRGQPGFYAHPWAAGERLPGGWFAEQYRIAEYSAYELTAPPAGQVWVRVGPDAVLINPADGTVIQTVTGVFE